MNVHNPMFVTIIAALTLVVPMLALAAPAIAAETPDFATATASIDLHFNGIATPTGAIMVGLYNSETGYATGKPLRSFMIAATTAAVTQMLTGLVPGRYAIKAFHDVDGDGQMAVNPFGMPVEPFAFSNDAPANMGPATWAAAAFDVAAGTTAHTITIK